MTWEDKMRRIVILASVLMILIVGVVVFVNKSNRYNGNHNITSPTVADTDLKTFKSSSAMKFTIQYPSNYLLIDKVDMVEMSNSNGSGSIFIIRNGTNFNSLEGYIENFDSKRKVNLSSTQSLTIDGFETMSRIIYTPGNKITQKSYYIFVNGTVYILSTQLESLYSDLDQIAQSFRYTP